MKKLYFLTVLFISSLYLVNAQQPKLIQEDENGNPEIITFHQGTKCNSTDSKQLLLSYLPNEQTGNFQLIETIEDKGIVSQKFQQYKNGIKVENGIYSLIMKNGEVLTLKGNYIDIKTKNVQKSQITEEQALQKALEYINADVYMWENTENEQWAKETEPNGTFFPTGELVYIKDYFNDDKLKRLEPVLAYKFNIYAEKPLSRQYVYVNAENGSIVFKDDIIKLFPINTNTSSGKSVLAKPVLPKSGSYAATRYSGIQTISTTTSGSNYVLKAYNRGGGIETFDLNNSTNYSNAVNFIDNNDQWTAEEFDNPEMDNAALDAHWGMEKVWDYWLFKHGRNSYDANGSIIKSYVHYGSNNDVAFWDGSVFSFGDGSIYDVITSLDAVAYAFGHAICDNTADLTYYGESGAITEGLSNIWAACIDHYANLNKSIWEIGEDIGGPSISLSNPNAYNQPDTYLGTYWYSGTSDNAGVHTNSGVLGFWFYLLSEGGSGNNDNGHPYNVTGIGIENAARIVYRTEAIYLNSDDNYSDMRTLTIVAAEDLFGAGSNAAEQVKNAWDAVGVYTLPLASSEYCNSYGNIYSMEWISQVQIGAFTNASGASGYTDFTHLSFNLVPGNIVNVTLTPGFSGGTWTEYWRIWIDLNGDKDFNDANELVFNGASTSIVSGSFMVPAASVIETRMRIAMKYASYSSSCEAPFTYGEVEDYTVNIFNPGAPTAPTNLTEVSKTQTSVNLSWDESTDDVEVIGYKIFQNGVEVKTVEGTTATIEGLQAQTSYIFYVVAYDGDDYLSIPSNSINVVTKSNYPNDTQAPSIPQNLNANNITQSSLNLYWNISTDNVGVAGYKVFQNGMEIKTVNTTNTTINGLSSSTGYSYYVKAFDNAGNISSASNTVNITTLSETPADTEAPTTPQNLTATDVGKTSLKLTWNASTDNIAVTRYRVYIGGSTYSYVTSNSILITGLSEGTQYDFRVRAYDAANNRSGYSNRVYVTTSSSFDNQAPSVPTGLNTIEINKTYARIGWNASTDNYGVKYYYVYLDGVYYSTTSSTDAIISGLNPGQEYNVYVKAYDDEGNSSANSSSIYFETLSDNLPGGGISYPSYGTSYGMNQSIEWIDYVGIGAIDNYTGPEAGGYGDYTGLTPTLLSAHSYDLYLSAGFSDYRDNEYWRIWIDFNIDGDFYDANELVAEGGPLAYDGIISAPFVVPVNIKSGYTVMRVSMKYGSYPNPYEIFTYGEVEDYPIELSTSKSANDQTQIKHSNTRDINDAIAINKMLLYPNPATNILTINNSPRDGQLQSINIYSASGSLLLTKELINNNEINISDLPAGIYTVVINTSINSINSKFIKQ